MKTTKFLAWELFVAEVSTLCFGRTAPSTDLQTPPQWETQAELLVRAFADESQGMLYGA